MHFTFFKAASFGLKDTKNKQPRKIRNFGVMLKFKKQLVSNSPNFLVTLTVRWLDNRILNETFNK